MSTTSSGDVLSSNRVSVAVGVDAVAAVGVTATDSGAS